MLIFDIEDASCSVEVSEKLHRVGVADWSVLVLNLVRPVISPDLACKNVYILLDSALISGHEDYSDDFVLDLIELGCPVLDRGVPSFEGNVFLADCETFGLELVKPIWDLSLSEYDIRVANLIHVLLQNRPYRYQYYGVHNCYLRVTVGTDLTLIKDGIILGNLRDTKDILSVICGVCSPLEDNEFEETFLSSYTVALVDYLFDVDVIATGERIKEFKMRLVEAIQDINPDSCALHGDYLNGLWAAGYVPVSRLKLVKVN